MVSHPGTPLRVDRLRALNLPQSVEVRTDTDGRPAAIRSPAPRSPHPAGPTPSSGAWKPLEAIIDTWRVDDEWWRKPVSRLYVEAVLEGGKRLLLYRDLITGQWFAQQP